MVNKKVIWASLLTCLIKIIVGLIIAKIVLLNARNEKQPRLVVIR